MSLSKALLYEVTSKGEISLNEVYDLCNELHYKHETAGRALRKLVENDLLDPIKPKNAIIGWILHEDKQETLI